MPEKIWGSFWPFPGQSCHSFCLCCCLKIQLLRFKTWHLFLSWVDPQKKKKTHKDARSQPFGVSRGSFWPNLSLTFCPIAPKFEPGILHRRVKTSFWAARQSSSSTWVMWWLWSSWGNAWKERERGQIAGQEYERKQTKHFAVTRKLQAKLLLLTHTHTHLVSQGNRNHGCVSAQSSAMQMM